MWIETLHKINLTMIIDSPNIVSYQARCKEFDSYHENFITQNLHIASRFRCRYTKSYNNNSISSNSSIKHPQYKLNLRNGIK